MPEQTEQAPLYEVYRYHDDSGAQYEEPHLHHTTDNLSAGQRYCDTHGGGCVVRVSDGAVWESGTEQWIPA